MTPHVPWLDIPGFACWKIFCALLSKCFCLLFFFSRLLEGKSECSLHLGRFHASGVFFFWCVLCLFVGILEVVFFGVLVIGRFLFATFASECVMFEFKFMSNVHGRVTRQEVFLGWSFAQAEGAVTTPNSKVRCKNICFGFVAGTGPQAIAKTIDFT